MPMLLDDSQTMLKDSAGGFLAEHGGVAELRRLRDKDDPTGFSGELWREFGEMGFNGLLVPEAEGGLALGHVEAGLILEAIGRNLTASPFLSSAVGGAVALGFAGKTPRGQWLGRIISGEAVAAIALATKPRAAMPEARSGTGGGFRLNGRVNFVPHGHVADVLVIAAGVASSDNDNENLALFAVPADQDGITRTAIRLADSQLYADIELVEVTAGPTDVISMGQDARTAMERTRDALCLGAASEQIGIALEALERTVAYLKERRQFGALVGSFQALQHRMAHLYCEIEVARSAVFKAQQLLDAGDDTASHAISVAKAMADRAGTLAVQEAVQLHGGIGMTDELDIGLFMKRAKVLSELHGNAEFHINRFACMAGF